MRAENKAGVLVGYIRSVANGLGLKDWDPGLQRIRDDRASCQGGELDLSADGNHKRLHVVVQGRVQGVGFRYFVIERADELHLVGLVRNLCNGDVEIIAEGEEGPLEALLVSLHNGPRMSHVENIHAAWSSARGEFTRFTVGTTQ